MVNAYLKSVTTDLAVGGGVFECTAILAFGSNGYGGSERTVPVLPMAPTEQGYGTSPHDLQVALKCY